MMGVVPGGMVGSAAEEFLSVLRQKLIWACVHLARKALLTWEAIRRDWQLLNGLSPPAPSQAL